MEDAVQVDVDLAAPLIVVHFPEVLLSRDEGEAGVVDEDVDAAELGDGAIDHRLDLLGLGDVKIEGEGAAAEGADLFGDGGCAAPGSVAFGLREVFVRAGERGDDDVCAVFGEADGDGAADAAHAAGAGDDGDFACEDAHRGAIISFASLRTRSAGVFSKLPWAGVRVVLTPSGVGGRLGATEKV